MMNVAEWVGAKDIHPQSAYRCLPEGELPVLARRVDGFIMVGGLAGNDPRPSGKTAIYAPKSSADHKCELDRQMARVTAWVTANGHLVDQVMSQVGSSSTESVGSSWCSCWISR